MTTLGAVCRPQVPPERLPGIAAAADEAGLDELWLWEDCFYQGALTCAAAALAGTRRLRVGVGLLPVPLRNVALTAMEVAALHRMFPGRVLIGLGHGVQDWMAQVGARVESPLTLLREHLTALRALLAGEEVSTVGRYVRLDRVALNWPPLNLPPLDLPPLNLPPLNLPPLDRPPRDLPPVDLPTAGPAAPGILAGGVGPRTLRLSAELHTPPPATDSSQLGVAGDARAVADAVLRWAAAGADTVVLQPTADEPDPEGFVRFAGREVAPLARVT